MLDGPTTPGEAGGIFAGVVALLSVLGGAIAWLFARHDRSEEREAVDEVTRAAKLDAWHRELLAREQLVIAQQTAFQARVDRHMAEQDDKIAGLEREIEKYRVAVPLLAARVAHNDPLDPVLGQVSKLLGQAFPLDGSAPGDMIRKLGELP